MDISRLLNPSTSNFEVDTLNDCRDMRPKKLRTDDLAAIDFDSIDAEQPPTFSCSSPLLRPYLFKPFSQPVSPDDEVPTFQLENSKPSGPSSIPPSRPHSRPLSPINSLPIPSARPMSSELPKPHSLTTLHPPFNLKSSGQSILFPSRIVPSKINPPHILRPSLETHSLPLPTIASQYGPSPMESDTPFLRLPLPQPPSLPSPSSFSPALGTSLSSNSSFLSPFAPSPSPCADSAAHLAHAQPPRAISHMPTMRTFSMPSSIPIFNSRHQPPTHDVRIPSPSQPRQDWSQPTFDRAEPLRQASAIQSTSSSVNHYPVPEPQSVLVNRQVHPVVIPPVSISPLRTSIEIPTPQQQMHQRQQKFTTQMAEEENDEDFDDDDDEEEDDFSVATPMYSALVW
eukprot:GILI01004577.1.p1 GENE.GILI01004577.1~~GILI01004577.1.p1  ORF type:complete len:398 (-),score=72.97 GILI01004577.1:13-1206(-)